MKRILAILLLVCFSCKQEEKPKIEIYLLDKKVESTEGVLFKHTELYKRVDSVEKVWYADRRVDTIKDKIIDGAKFEVTEKDLPLEPFISDYEIKNFILNKNIIVFDSVVVQRLKNVKPNLDNEQFVITANRKPLLTGYFWNIFSSQTCNWYSIITIDPFGLDKKVGKTKSYWIGHISDGHYPSGGVSKRPPYPPELIEAFRSTGRLIE